MLYYLFLLPSPSLAQFVPWDQGKFTKIFDFTVDKPDIYLQEDSPIYNTSDSYKFTTTSCVDNTDCSSGDVCLPNSDEPPKYFCATPEREANWDIKIESTDYNPDINQSQKLPKLQNLSEHYFQNPTLSANTLNYGSLELLLPASYKLELKLAALEQALATFKALPEIVIGPMPNRDLTLYDGTKTTYIDLYNQLPSYLIDKPKGWQERALKDPNPLVKAISLVNPSPYDVNEYAYAYHEVKVLGIRFSRVEPYLVYPRGDLFSTYEYAKITLPNSVLQPFKKDPPILALTNTNKLLRDLGGTESYDSYFSALANRVTNKEIPSLPNDVAKPEADATQKTGSSGFKEFITKLFDIKSLTMNFPSPSQISTNKLIALIGAHKITSQELSDKPLDDKAFPALTSANNFSLNMGQGGGVSTLTDTFSRLLPCEADVYSSEIPIKEYLGGKRQTCSGGGINPSPGPTSCYVNPSCNNTPASEDLAGVKENFIALFKMPDYLGGLGVAKLDFFDTVVAKSIAKGVSPIFSLAIWLHESAASNYDAICQYLGKGNPTSGYCQRILDFGINIDAIATTSKAGGGWNIKFDEQLDYWLNTPDFYLTNYCVREFAKPGACAWGIFGSAFSIGNCTDMASGNQYTKDVMTFYHLLTSSQAEPCYPIALP
ncbi:MAG: hypothetical protein ABII80_02315 [bacterium]